MLALILCLFVLGASYAAGRRGLVPGITVALAAGYSYGIMRANLLTPASHFLADAGVLGLFASQLFRPLPPSERRRLSAVRAWMFVLIVWPVILFLVPVQDIFVQLVGLRGAIFILGFLILGARLTSEEWYRLAIWCAALNLAAFALAVAEYALGIEPFFPESQVTEIMYRSRVLLGQEGGGGPLYRIPSSFSSAHAYGGTMVMTLPILLGAWVAASRIELRAVVRNWHRVFLLAAIAASVLGVFMSAARQHAVMLFLLLLTATVVGRLRTSYRVAWLLVLLIVGVVVSQNQRLQRFTSLDDEELVRGRVQISVNEDFLDYAERYPMGNGLGGGGTSIPYFLMERVRPIVPLENEYGRIMLEQGIPGLLMWLGFVGWIAFKGVRLGGGEWAFARRLSWVMVTAYFLTAAIGLGLLASVPQSFVFFLLAGWVAAPPPRRAAVRASRKPLQLPALHPEILGRAQ